MKGEIEFHRSKGYTLHIASLANVVCHQCGSGEVHQFMQTMDMPMYWECLNCGTTVPSANFDTLGESV